MTVGRSWSGFCLIFIPLLQVVRYFGEPSIKSAPMKYRVQILNSISRKGLDTFPSDQYMLTQDGEQADGVVLRSHNLHGAELPEKLKVISRAGAGVNNIPIALCTERGIAVFNTPGANANSVKELVLCGLFLASRRVIEGINWVRELATDDGDVGRLVEGGKNRFKGPEILGKTLGVIGLGAIGVSVANAASALGMDTIGHDPFISVDAAWGVSREVRRAHSLEELLRASDYVTLHAPLNDHTRDLIGARELALMRPGARLLNFARGGLVDDEAVLAALGSGALGRYVTDFVDMRLARHPGVVPVPHLGASTPEAEDNCAVMAVQQLRNYLELGTVRNSVNFPRVELPYRPGTCRIQIVNRNEPNMIRQLTGVVADAGINIANLVNKGRGVLAYTLIDLAARLNNPMLARLAAIDGVVRVRRLGG